MQHDKNAHTSHRHQGPTAFGSAVLWLFPFHQIFSQPQPSVKQCSDTAADSPFPNRPDITVMADWA